MEEVFAKLRLRIRGGMKPRSTRLGVFVFSLIFAFGVPATAGSFTGSYDLSNWTLINTNADGSAMTPDLGLSLILTGGNNGSGNPGITDFVITAPASGTISFQWNYSSLDATTPVCGPFGNLICDDGGYLLNSVYTGLADDTTQGSGSTSFLVTSGESFGFRINTADNQGEPGILTITDFSGPVDASVPEPGTFSVVLGLAAMAGIVKWRGKLRAKLIQG